MRSLCALSIASFFRFPPRTRLIHTTDLCRRSASSRCVESGDIRGSGIISSSTEGIAASLSLRIYLAGDMSVRVGCQPSCADSFFYYTRK